MGYLLGTLAADAKRFGIDEYFSWRRAFFTQGIALYIIAFFFMCYPNEKLDIMAVDDDEDEAAGLTQSDRQMSRPDHKSPRSGRKPKASSIPIFDDICTLMVNPIYMSTMLVITSMYFSVTGLQFWTI